MKVCQRCKIEKDESEFHKHKKTKDGLQVWCKKCKAEVKREYIRLPEIRKRNAEQVLKRSRLHGVSPMSENNKCASFLGVYIAEGVLSKIFKNVIRMPNNNPGYDFICSRGFKIDVKSAVMIYPEGRSPIWNFVINHNKIADYFICIAFDNRDNLNPQHIWMIPGKDINDKLSFHISTNPKFTKLWSKYEKTEELQKAIMCCNKIRQEQ